jgi:hypothetical protein
VILTNSQDPADRFPLLTEEVRRVRDARHGLARPLVLLICELFLCMLRTFARLAEQVRNGTLPVAAPAGAPDQPRAWPADLRPRESGWLEHRNPKDAPRDAPRDASGGGTMHGPFERPEMASELNEPVAEVPCEIAPCEMPGVEQPAGLPLPRRARVRKLKVSSGPASARARHVDDGCWPRWRKAGLLWTTEAGFLRFDSEKMGLRRRGLVCSFRYDLAT